MWAWLFPGLQGWECAWQAQLAGLAVSLGSFAWDGLRKSRVVTQLNPRVSPPHLELALARLSALKLDVPQCGELTGEGMKSIQVMGRLVSRSRPGLHSGDEVGSDIHAGRGCQD